PALARAGPGEAGARSRGAVDLGACPSNRSASPSGRRRPVCFVAPRSNTPGNSRYSPSSRLASGPAALHSARSGLLGQAPSSVGRSDHQIAASGFHRDVRLAVAAAKTDHLAALDDGLRVGELAGDVAAALIGDRL